MEKSTLCYEMSAKSIVEKLRLKDGDRALFLNAPDNYLKMIAPLHENLLLEKDLTNSFDFIQLFVKNRQELQSYLFDCKKQLKPKGKLWITYYKGSSKFETDINRDSINDYVLTLGLKGIAIISIDKDWSAVRFKII